MYVRACTDRLDTAELLVSHQVEIERNRIKQAAHQRPAKS